VIGDIHGRVDLLHTALDLIEYHAAGTQATDAKVIFLGNYIDHGPDSVAALKHISRLNLSMPQSVTCLMGSHERMLLDFLAQPAARSARWLRNGGVAMLDNFDLDLEPAQLGKTPYLPDLEHAARVVTDTLGSEMLDWVSNLPLTWSSGNLWAVHAGADPARAMDQQSNRVLLWGHPEFNTSPRGDGAWIIHGHQETPHPKAKDQIISIDTGAWHSGKLTICAIEPDGRFDFLQT
jgi:serine/threonine protein phosphatase 1